jgi:hypothetical protein
LPGSNARYPVARLIFIFFFRDLMALTPPVGRNAASVWQKLCSHARVIFAIVIILPATEIKMTGL